MLVCRTRSPMTAITMTEAELLEAVRDLARYRKWLTYHTHRSDRSEPGFPDLVMARADRLIFAELKSETGKMSVPQRTWMTALRAFDGAVEYHLWTPRDWHNGRIDDVLA